MGQQMRSVAPTPEWIAFASRSEYLLDPDTPLRNPMTINYPGKEDPSVIPVHQGILERKKRYTKTYKGELRASCNSNKTDFDLRPFHRGLLHSHTCWVSIPPYF